MPETTTPSDARAKPETAAATGKPEAPMIETIASAQEETLHKVEAAGAAMFEGFTKAQKEISAFLTERIRQDVETQAELLSCRSLDEVRDLQTRFLKTAMDQYSAEASRLMKIGVDVMAMSLPSHSR